MNDLPKEKRRGHGGHRVLLCKIYKRSNVTIEPMGLVECYFLVAAAAFLLLFTLLAAASCNF